MKVDIVSGGRELYHSQLAPQAAHRVDPGATVADFVGLVLVADHGLFRAGLAELLGTVPGCAVLGQGASADEAVALAREHRPDIAMLADEVPGPDVGSTVLHILRESPRTKVVVLAAQDDPDILRQALEAGASAFLTRNAGRAELVAAVEWTRREPDSFLLAASRSTLSAVIHPRVVTRSVTLSSPLTAQESRVLELLAQGQPNRRIAVELFISETTVKRHLTNIYRKLDVTSRLQAVTRADQIGLLRGRSGG